MKILHLYIWKGLVISFLMSLTVFTLVLFIGNIFQVIPLLSKQIDPLLMFRFLFYTFPYILVYSIPMSILAACLLLFGQLSADNEITAMRACGIPIRKIFLTGFLTAAVLTVFCLWLSDGVFAKCHLARRHLKEAFGAEVALVLLEPGEEAEFSGYRIYIADRKGDTFTEPYIEEFLPDGRRRVIKAEEGEIHPDEKSGEVILTLHRGVMEEPNKNNPDSYFHGRFRVYHIRIPVQEMIERNEAISKGTKDMTFREIWRIADRDRKKLQKSPPLAKPRIAGRVSRYLTDAEKRRALAVACIAFAAIGMPLGIRAHRSEKTIGFVISLALVAVYHGALSVAEAFKEAYLLKPYLLIWAPNAVLIILGIILIWSLDRR